MVFTQTPAMCSSPLLPMIVNSHHASPCPGTTRLLRSMEPAPCFGFPIRKAARQLNRKWMGMLHLIATEVLAINFSNYRLIYVGHEWPDNQFRIVASGSSGIARATTLDQKVLRAFFGPPSRLVDSAFGLLALEQADS